jgi:hypothetical protein
VNKFLTFIIVIIVLLPGVTFARVDTAASKCDDALRFEMMKHIIVLLQTYLAYLQPSVHYASQGTPTVLGIATSSATTIEEIKQRRNRCGLGAGGRSSSSATVTTQSAPLVVDMVGATNTFSVTANQPLQPTEVVIDLENLPTNILKPSQILLRAALTGGTIMTIPLSNAPSTRTYTADLRDRIGPDDSWLGVFTVEFPSTVAPAYLQYTATLSTNGVVRTANLENRGVGATGLVFSESNENPTSTTVRVKTNDTTEGVTMLGFTMRPTGGFVLLERVYVEIEASEPVFNVLAQTRLRIHNQWYSSTEITTNGHYSDTSVLVRFDVDTFVNYQQEVNARLEVDILPQGDQSYPNGTALRAWIDESVALTRARGDGQLASTTISGGVEGTEFQLDSSNPSGGTGGVSEN